MGRVGDMSDFLLGVSYVLGNEGGFVEDPDDIGGATNMGITMAELAAYRGTGVTVDDVKNLTKDEAQAIYEKHYWEPLGCAGMPQAVAMAVMDTGVNQGVSNTQVHVQEALQQCGDPHPAPNLFLSKFIPLVQNHYVWLIKQKPEQVKFLGGWLSRSQKLLSLMV